MSGTIKTFTIHLPLASAEFASRSIRIAVGMAAKLAHTDPTFPKGATEALVRALTGLEAVAGLIDAAAREAHRMEASDEINSADAEFDKAAASDSLPPVRFPFGGTV